MPGTALGTRALSFGTVGLAVQGGDMTLIRKLMPLLLVAAAGCGPSEQQTAATDAETAALEVASGAGAAEGPPTNPVRDAYFGDTHIHTILSFDAYLMGTRRTPDDAYEFAKGAAIEHASGFMMQLNKPLDFLAVSDHAFYLGMMREIAEARGRYQDHSLADVIRGVRDAQTSSEAFAAVLTHLRERMSDPSLDDDLDDREVARSAWQEIIEAAQRHNDPGNFTTFIGYEYTSSGPETQNLHRNVIFRGSSVPAQPFARLDSLNPEDLWAWMDANRARGMDAIAIPHNSNGSDGWMFQKTNWTGDPIDAGYAETRMRNEPLVENTQVKGTSDTHPLLSPNDEWADFELMQFKVATTQPSRAPGSYVREAYLNGLVMEEQGGFNPYRFGVIGASDTHNAAGSFQEDNYWSKTGVTDIEPYMRGSVPLPSSTPDEPRYADGASQYWGASGLAGVWAEANTREAIFEAMRRKETFSTSGPRIRVRFFAGYDYSDDLLGSPDILERAYAGGVPMGADLLPSAGQTPKFLIWAARDVDSVALQRLQVIKGWLENGEPRERVMDVACSDGAEVDPATRRCPDNGAAVDLSTCAVTENSGASQLLAVWQDPDFDPAQRAFYYVRVLENPKCRWSTWDAIRAGVPPNPKLHATIQDRAWSSPIWYRP
jgi:hypothetical protein